MTPTPPTRKNNALRKSITLGEIAELVGGKLTGKSDILITGVAGIKDAKAGDITFLASPKYLPFLKNTQASAVVTGRDVDSVPAASVQTDNPSVAFTKIVTLFSPAPEKKTPGVHPTAVVHPSAKLGKDVFVGPNVTIDENAVIGAGSSIGAGCYIGSHVELGQEVCLDPNVTVLHDVHIGNRVVIHSGTVIGSEGFGYETVDGVHTRLPHTGIVVIEDEVEIGANVCVDRGRFDKTWIQKGTKIDNLVQIAHNVVIGAGSLIVSQAGISGSTELGRGVILAGQAGLVGHITLGDNVIVGAGAGVTKSVPEKTVVLGSPAKPMAEQKKIFALIARLPDLFKDIADLKKKIK